MRVISASASQLGSTQLAVLYQVINGPFINTQGVGPVQTAALKLSDYGILDRDPQNSHRFTLSISGAHWSLTNVQVLSRRFDVILTEGKTDGS